MRHIRDAEHLAEAATPFRSLDQSYHLAGFGPECIRKATLDARWIDKPLGHLLGKAADPLIELALDLDPVARRYNPLNWAERYPALAKWDPQCRYAQTGHHSQNNTMELISEARAAVDSIASALWADGRLDAILFT
ncbi:hypothetical protein [Corallococcus caeni]|uniref:hypothetical protein n=1 Tax=Corallococcus caeni TaxID=3082388 RepID=UPI0030C73936